MPEQGPQANAHLFSWIGKSKNTSLLCSDGLQQRKGNSIKYRLEWVFGYWDWKRLDGYRRIASYHWEI